MKGLSAVVTSSGTSIVMTRAAHGAKGRKSALIATLKNVCVFAICRAGSPAVTATRLARGWMNGKYEGDAQHLEGDVRDGDTPRVGGGAQARGQRRRARADVGAQDDGDGAVERQEPLLGEREHEADRRDGGCHARAEDRAQEEPQAGIARERHQHLARELAVRHGRHRLGHDAHAEKDEAEAQHGLPEALHEPAPAKESEREAGADHEQGQVLDLEGQELHGEGRPDVRAQDHAERLAEGDEPRRHEADQHERGRRRGLDEHRRERA